MIAVLGVAGVAQAPFAKEAESAEEVHLKANQETAAQKKGRAGKDQEGAAGPEKGPVLEQIEQSKQQCRFGLCQQQVRASGQPGL